MIPSTANKAIFLVVVLALLLPSCNTTGYDHVEGELIETGIASWYGHGYEGVTANGEYYDPDEFTAAHKELPFNSIVRVLNIENGETVTVRINDRGPFVEGRVIDLSKVAAEEIGIIVTGLAEVELYLIKEGDGQTYYGRFN